SSKICSCCGSKQDMPLSDRVYSCSCGSVMDRDYNAAINIKNEGIRLLALA
ncbi:zinc ribbon domain-containing protein, partial [Fictibacillus macauensis]|uniref:zinc ribbon domain-containing protein n=1 Tax=Fictibacillus macauensis TaxID=245160 RepID=UPI0012EA08CA